MNFKDFCKTEKSKEEAKETIETKVKKDNNANKINENDVKEKLEQYSNYSQEELLQEFLSQSQSAKEKGVYNDKNIESIKSTLFPFLSEEQRKKFDSLINMVK